MMKGEGTGKLALHDGSGIEIEVITSLARLRLMATAWERLLDRTGATSPFLHPAFLLPWFIQAEQDGFRIYTMAMWRGERLVGLLPLSLKSTGIPGLANRRLGPPLYGSTPPFDLVLSESPASLPAAIDFFFDRLVTWDTIRWPAMPTNSLVATILADQLRRKGHSVVTIPVEERFAVETRDGWDAYRASLRNHQRKEIERSWRTAERMGPSRLETFRPGDGDLEDHLAHARLVIASSWKNSDEMVDRGLEHLERMSRSLNQAGMFLIHTLIIDERPVAYLSEIEQGQRRYAFHIAYDDNYSAVSPGRLILNSALRMAFEEGMQSYEFCGFREYLRRLANASVKFCSVEVTNRSALSRLRVGCVGILRRLVDRARVARHTPKPGSHLHENIGSRPIV